MSTDEEVTKDLIQTLEDGKAGFAKGAEKLSDSDRPELATEFRRWSDQRGSFAAELQEMAKQYGDELDRSGSVAGAVHRGWLSLKDAVTGSDPHAVLSAAEQGEDHAVGEFEKALKSDISAGLRSVVERQAADVRAARDSVRAMAKATD